MKLFLHLTYEIITTLLGIWAILICMTYCVPGRYFAFKKYKIVFLTPRGGYHFWRIVEKDNQQKLE